MWTFLVILQWVHFDSLNLESFTSIQLVWKYDWIAEIIVYLNTEFFQNDDRETREI